MGCQKLALYHPNGGAQHWPEYFRLARRHCVCGLAGCRNGRRAARTRGGVYWVVSGRVSASESRASNVTSLRTIIGEACKFADWPFILHSCNTGDFLSSIL